MLKITAVPALLVALLAGTALGNSTAYAPVVTGFTLPNAQQAVTASSAETATYAATAGSTGYAINAGTATNANFATSAGSAKTATNATNAINATNAGTADSASYADNAGVAQQAAGLTAGKTCAAGTALSVTKGVLGCVSSVTSITGNLNGSQIVGAINNASSINISGNIVTDGYVYGVNGLFTDNAVFSNTYVGRQGGANAAFYGNANSATTASSANTANYATTSGSTNYAASTDVGILRQTGPGDGSTFYCDAGYHLVFYDLNVNSTNNAFFYECIQNGH